MTRDLWWERTDYEAREALAIEESNRLTPDEDTDGDRPDEDDDTEGDDEEAPEPWECRRQWSEWDEEGRPLVDRGPDPRRNPG